MNNVVEVRGAFKRYGTQKPILRGLNMTVRARSIYGLLGPSGCGKTTLLSCIVGRKTLDAGFIRLAITSRSQLGYMPQEIALFQEFTIREIFNFYGQIFSLRYGELKRRSKELSNILELPSFSRTIGSLSGGQQRRVSLAVTLLHNPNLLILDEPTVGLDPILCQNIWHYLLKLVTVENKAIIITTHYIEEAKQAHVIGLMREGVLLSEDSPNQLLASTNCTYLEEAFLELSKRQHLSLRAEEEKGILTEYPKKPKISPPPLINNVKFSFHRFKAQLIKNIYWLQRNVPIMAFLLLLPALQSFLYCSSFGHNPKNLPVGLVSEELSHFGTFSWCSGNNINNTYNSNLQCDVPVSFSCTYIEELAKTMNITMYDSIELAKLDVASNKVWGVLHLSKNFTESFIERLSLGLDTDEISLDQSIITVWMDMTNYIISNQLRRDIMKSLVNFIKKIIVRCGMPENLGDIPMRFNNAVFGTNEPVFAHNGLPGFICSFAFYFTMTFTSGAIMMEKIVGLLERSMIAGMTRLEVTLAHLVIQMLLMVAQTSVMLMVLYVFFGNPLIGDLKLIIALLACIEFVGIAYGFLLTEIFSTDKMTTYAGIGTVLSLFLITGILWPLEGAHIMIRGWAKAFPVVAAVESYSSVSLKGYPITHHAVYEGFVSCGFWIITFSLLAVLLAKIKKGL